MKTILDEAREASRKAVYDGRDQVKAIVDIVEQAHEDRRIEFEKALRLAVEYARTDAHKALIVKLEGVLQELKGGAP